MKYFFLKIFLIDAENTVIFNRSEGMKIKNKLCKIWME